MDQTKKAFASKIAIVTGAASGLGLASAGRLAEQGAIIVGIDLQAGEGWQTLAERAPNAEFHQADVTHADALQQIANNTVKRHGHIDILLTAAGVAAAGPLSMLEVDAWRRVIDINLNGTAFAVKAVLETMIAQRSGSIITVASIEGTIGTEGGSAYNASKGGVVLLSKNVAIDYARLGVRCNCICPGFIDTPMLRSILYTEGMDALRESVIGQIKMGRLGRAEEIAAAVCFLASEDSSYMTGQNLIIDGGYTAGMSHGVVEMMGLL